LRKQAGILRLQGLARTFSTFRSPLKGQKMARIANFWTFRKKCENILTIPEIFLDVDMGYLV
jgi:hypothetical protein